LVWRLIGGLDIQAPDACPPRVLSCSRRSRSAGGADASGYWQRPPGPRRRPGQRAGGGRRGRPP